MRRAEKIPVPKASSDELFDGRLRAFAPKKNAALLLLPLSGSNELVGRGILNACLLAGGNAKNIDFYVLDTADHEKHATLCRLRHKNFIAIIGPVFFQEVARYGALFQRTPILSFSNNLKINSDHVFACGLSPEDEIHALFAYADSQQINSFLTMLPDGELGNQIQDIIKRELKKYGLEEGEDLEILRYSSISRKAATKYVNNSNKKAVFVINPIINISKLENAQVFTLSSAALSVGNTWEGAVFAFSDNPEQQEFIAKYCAVFGAQPSVLDMIGCDLMKIVKESIKYERPIVQNFHIGCLGEFFIDKERGLQRKLSIYRRTDSGKEELLQ
ncbi:MAG: penicillin-binding protein activator [Holosporaceae bacterium]|jgi:ABC-type branched-subunit amino acid transport system substrate-binding protein|nr:penicillin-binding protein activator [Holosporaceae bacterium]